MRQTTFDSGRTSKMGEIRRRRPVFFYSLETFLITSQFWCLELVGCLAVTRRHLDTTGWNDSTSGEMRGVVKNLVGPWRRELSATTAACTLS